MLDRERDFFIEHGYVHCEGVLTGGQLADIQRAFDEVWEAEKAPPCSQHQLLKYEHFVRLIEHPPILDRQRALFGNQIQLLQYDLLRQGARSDFPSRRWHRDFSFPGERTLAVNTILFLDDIREEQGPTRVVPGTHRGEALPPPDRIHEPLDGELPVFCQAGDAIFINAAIWHTGGRNTSDGLRRGVYLYYGYWWLKRYESERQLPWQAFEGASQTRLQLLGGEDARPRPPHVRPVAVTRSPSRPRSGGHEAGGEPAVDEQHRSRHEGGVVRGEERRARSHVGGGPDPSHGLELRQLALEPCGVRLGIDPVLGEAPGAAPRGRARGSGGGGPAAQPRAGRGARPRGERRGSPVAAARLSPRAAATPRSAAARPG